MIFTKIPGFRHLSILLTLLLLPAIFSTAGNIIIPHKIRKGKDIALFFAVDKYDNYKPLKNPIRNAQTIADELEKRYDFTTRVYKNPSLDEIENVLNEYKNKYRRNQLDADGQLFIYFSGHGTEDYFIVSDTKKGVEHRSGLSYSFWRNALDEFNCKHILVAIDACYSATFDPLWRSRTSPKFSPPGENGKRDYILKEHNKYKTRFFFTSDAKKEQTPDNSQFAFQFITALRRGGGKDGLLTSTDVYTDLEDAIPRGYGGRFGSSQPTASFLFIENESYQQKNWEEDIRNEKDLTAWNKAKNTHSIAAYREYLKSFPSGLFAQEATLRLNRLRDDQDWEIARERNDADYYLDRHSNGRHVTEAEVMKKPSPPDNMVLVKGGSFQMGDQFGGGESDEQPVHEVTLSDFYIGRTEVMVSEFSDFISATGYKTDAEKGGGSYFYKDGEWKKTAGIDWRYDAEAKRRSAGTYNHPVIHVSWNDAVAFCNWRSREHGLKEVYKINGGKVTADWNANGYRLPTEAEWEYASRSRGKKEKWAGTSSESALAAYANFCDKNCGESWKKEGANDGYAFTAPVRSFKANDLGLYDMSGNVWEWCWDWYKDDFYKNSLKRNPKGADSGSNRVLRGGSWNDSASGCRSAGRNSGDPGGRDDGVGFRLARS